MTFAAFQPGLAAHSHVVRLGYGQVRMSDIVEMTHEAWLDPIAVDEDMRTL
ncbi:hypothetical protein OF122_03705 [Pelagibacterium flavum]|uniref:Uncharacterized protein n=1 Tax=Pelagibacterium flavum TaxID=2984530 RepID=A0ABY6IYF7_9HYPH|nr:hypothetical protein [Pelagibacterium sp. YIM 151497]UYQ74205.1 hypothetical protein OF122_03705 [Pelagibacterium sp. YIM 151497]